MTAFVIEGLFDLEISAVAKSISIFYLCGKLIDWIQILITCIVATMCVCVYSLTNIQLEIDTQYLPLFSLFQKFCDEFNTDYMKWIAIVIDDVDDMIIDIFFFIYSIQFKDFRDKFSRNGGKMEK